MAQILPYSSAMTEKNEQEKPLASTAHQIDVDHFRVEFTSRRRQRCIKCCGCSAAVSLILVVAILVLMLTVFHMKDPILKLNSVKIDGMDLLSGNTSSLPGHNLTFVAEVSLKNPNAASFKFDNTTTYVNYDGSMVGEIWTPAGRIGPRRTLSMNVLVDIAVNKIVGAKRFKSDLIKGILSLSTDTRISGKVKITDVMKKSVVVELNCTMNVNVSSHAVEDTICR